MPKSPIIYEWISALLAVAAGLVAVFSILTGDGGALFLLFLLLALLPGLVAARLLWPGAGTGRALLAAFYLGLAVLFAQYFLLNAVGALNALQWSVPVLAVLSLAALLFFARRNGTPILRQAAALPAQLARHHLLLWVIAAGVWYSYYLTNIRFSTPDTVYSADMQWHMGNIYTLAAPGFQDIRIFGMTFRYHYFADLLYAAGRIVFGFLPYNCVLRFPALLTPALMGLSVYLLAGLAVQKRWLRALVAAVVLYVFPLFGRYNDFAYQWLTNVNAVGVAVPCMILVLLVVRASNTLSVRRLLPLLALATAVLAGLKGPFAVCVVAGAVGAPLYALLKKDPHLRRWLAVSGGIALGFLPVWFALLRGGMNSAYLFTDRLLMAVSHADVLSRPIIALGDNFLARLVFLPVQYLFVTGIFGIPFLFALVRALISLFRRGKAVETADFFYIFGAFLSFGAYYYYDMIGRSQNYFLLGACVLMVVPALGELRRWGAALAAKPRPLKTGGAAAGIAVAVFCAVFSAFHPMLEDHIGLYTKNELRAIQWIIDNVPDDALIAVNRHEAFYLVSGFTGKRIYLEGTRYAKNSGVTEAMLAGMIAQNDSLFDAAVPSAQRTGTMQALGIDYLVQWKNSYTDTELTAPLGDDFEVCFVSDDVLIWQRSY